MTMNSMFEQFNELYPHLIYFLSVEFSQACMLCVK